jgi:hypothetical protein
MNASRTMTVILPKRWRLPMMIGGLLALCFSALLPLAVSARALDPPSPVPHAICTGATIPRGWVILDYQTDWSQCEGGLFHPNNLEIIAPTPAQPTAVCMHSPVLAQWVVLSENTDFSRCNMGNPVWDEITIAPATGGEHAGVRAHSCPTWLGDHGRDAR